MDSNPHNEERFKCTTSIINVTVIWRAWPWLRQHNRQQRYEKMENSFTTRCLVSLQHMKMIYKHNKQLTVCTVISILLSGHQACAISASNKYWNAIGGSKRGPYCIFVIFFYGGESPVCWVILKSSSDQRLLHLMKPYSWKKRSY